MVPWFIDNDLKNQLVKWDSVCSFEVGKPYSLKLLNEQRSKTTLAVINVAQDKINERLLFSQCSQLLMQNYIHNNS